MNSWTLANPKTKDDLYTEWLIHEKILIKIHCSGQYPILIRKDGKFDHELAHIEVILGYFKENNHIYYTDVTVKIFSPKKRRESIIKTIWKSGPQPKSLSPDILINLAKIQFSLALDSLKNLKQDFKKAKARVKQARAYPTVFFTRKDYVSACQELQVDDLSEIVCQSYGVQHGIYKFPDFSGDHCLMMKLAKRRLRGIFIEIKENTLQQNPIPLMQIELQEECKICSQEPSYLPLHLCEHCWPKS